MICPISPNLVLNQSSISAVFQIVRFLFAPTSVLFEDSLYYVFLANVVVELQDIEFENANYHTKMDFFGTSKFDGS